ncbi:MAG: hypothetical protein ACI31O_02475 [Limosilactobacillus vaginalis]|uniref:hypothetical protein n=1 Tax=Limosilactobacillus vaginalis TaxID=1633 RepID=UPI003F035368
MSLYDRTLEEKILSQKIIDIEDQIINAGGYINSITEDCFEGTITDGNGRLIADDPISSANEIVKVAKEIKELAIQYKTLTNLESKIMDTKKAAESEPTTTPDTIND